MSVEKNSFLLSYLIESELIEDNVEEYAILSYPNDIVLNSATLYVKYLSQNFSKISLKKKKSIKHIVQNLGAVLCLTLKDFSLFRTSIEIYSIWLKKSEIFGNLTRQNKYFRRIFKQLSSPFEFRSPTNHQIFAQDIFSVLDDILTLYDQTRILIGKNFEILTWEILIKVLIGITESLISYNIKLFFTDIQISKLRDHSLELIFKLIITSGLKDEKIWKIFENYCLKWNENINFIKTWGYFIKIFTNNFFEITLNLNLTNLIDGGIYDNNLNSISNEMIQFLFSKFLIFLNYNNILKKKELFFEVQSILLIILNELKLNTEKNSNLLIIKFPSIIFLKFFGKLITFIDNNIDIKFDEGISILIQILINLIVKFDYLNNELIKNKLFFYLIKIININKKLINFSFLNYSHLLFEQNFNFLSFLSLNSLNLINSLNFKEISKISNNQFEINLFQIFNNSIYYNNDQNLIKKTYQFLLENITSNHIKFQLLCLTFSYDFSQIETIYYIILHFKEELKNSSSFLSSIIQYLGIIIKFNPIIYKQITSFKIINLLLSFLLQNEFINIEGYDSIIYSTLLMLNNLLEWVPDFFNDPINNSNLFKFITFN